MYKSQRPQKRKRDEGHNLNGWTKFVKISEFALNDCNRIDLNQIIIGMEKLSITDCCTQRHCAEQNTQSHNQMLELAEKKYSAETEEFSDGTSSMVSSPLMPDSYNVDFCEAIVPDLGAEVEPPYFECAEVWTQFGDSEVGDSEFFGDSEFLDTDSDESLLPPVDIGIMPDNLWPEIPTIWVPELSYCHHLSKKL